MKALEDKFSGNSPDYKRYRPTYPLPFLEEIIGLSRQRIHCWDCGTGNGQVASVLSGYFENVQATDMSEDQIQNAFKAENIQYHISRVEKTNFPEDSFDLITAAQAAHWFDHEVFFNEVKRVSRSQGIIALWGYGLLRFNNELDKQIDAFYNEVLGSYWDSERKHIEQSYKTIDFPFPQIGLSKNYFINKSFSLDEFIGYLGTWSAVKKFNETEGYSPLDSLLQKIKPFWPDERVFRTAHFPIFTLIGLISK